jgi:hypothetical protein
LFTPVDFGHTTIYNWDGILIGGAPRSFWAPRVALRINNCF